MLRNLRTVHLLDGDAQAHYFKVEQNYSTNEKPFLAFYINNTCYTVDSVDEVEGVIKLLKEYQVEKRLYDFKIQGLKQEES